MEFLGDLPTVKDAVTAASSMILHLLSFIFYDMMRYGSSGILPEGWNNVAEFVSML